ncbi:hypothetical protein [Silanimonas algicola]
MPRREQACRGRRVFGGARFLDRCEAFQRQRVTARGIAPTRCVILNPPLPVASFSMRPPLSHTLGATVLALALAACKGPSTANVDPAALPGTTEARPAPAMDAPPAEAASSTGVVSQDATSMPIVDHVAWWSSENQTLHVVLSPALLAPAERKRLIEGESAFMVLSSRPSPDDSRWQWFPFAKVELAFRDDSRSTEALRHVYLMAYGIHEANFTTNINLLGAVGEGHRIDVVAFEGERLRLKTEGMQAIGDDTHTWAIDIAP